uniref:Uncharacterized protein n=1 Tax=Romanomermis culicivorax TaxID=13658 RepID=A0A915KIK9_ROMCU
MIKAIKEVPMEFNCIRNLSTLSSIRSNMAYQNKACLSLQAQIRDVKMWGFYKCEKLDLLFDIHACLDSDLINDENTGAVRFMLRDSTGAMQATYFAIDQPLPDIRRGQWVRIGGTTRPWGFQATSVQPATADFLHGLYEKLSTSRMAIQKRIEELKFR